MCQRYFRRVNERVEVRETTFPWDGKLSLKADKPQVDQRYEDVERQQEYYHIVIFLERT